jgi:hypothetical protein
MLTAERSVTALNHPNILAVDGANNGPAIRT